MNLSWLVAPLALTVMTSFPDRAARADEKARYVGAQACGSCHSAAFDAWKTSHHALAMQPATPATVRGDFSGVRFEQNSEATTFLREQNVFHIRTEGSDGKPHDYPLAYTFGVDLLQQYLVPFPGGRYQAFGVAWDTRPREQGGQRWYSLYPDHPPRPGDSLHWTRRDQTWNFQCAACHSTDLRKNFDLATNSYATTFSDVNVACEACHGPGSRHIAWAGAKTDDPRKGLTPWLTLADRGLWQMNPDTGIAHRTTPAASGELNACGGCHARRSAIADDATAATPFPDAYLPALLDPGLYHADGQIDGEVFEYGSFVQSRMYRAGVTCTNCHDPHTATLRAQGNTLCAQCHMPQKFDALEHHHHQAGSAGTPCIECHMPAKTYMGVHRRHDHSFRVPRPDLSETIGVPNTCTQCHADKSAEWAAQAIAAWFPAGRQTTSHYGLALQAGRSGAVDAEARLDALIHDASTPAIARATALRLLGPYATAASDPGIVASISDPDPLVRQAVPATLAGQASQRMVPTIIPLLSDPVRSVRIETARALAGIDLRALTPAQQIAYNAALKELVAADMVNADRPEAHLNLGLLAVRLGQADQAEAQYQTALRLDPDFVPGLVNLADLERMRGMDRQGAVLLNKAAAIEPGNADAHFALGLLLVRQHDPSAIKELRLANELAPNNARYAYVYAVALNSQGATEPAVALLERAHQQHPADREILVALVSMAQQQGDRSRALRHARELAAIAPGDERVRMLVRRLGGEP